MRLKSETRIVGIDDASFDKCDDIVLIIGSIFRGGFWMDGMLSTYVAVDGLDATDKISDMISGCKYQDLRIIMLAGITVGGFNVIDIPELNERTGLPVIAVTERHPNFEKIENALTNVSDVETRLDIMKKAGNVYAGPNNVFYQVCGMDAYTAKRVIYKTSTRSYIPEPLRVSHIIASGLSRGESAKR